MSPFKFRGFVSLLLTLTFLVVVATGLVLWLAHSPQTFGIGKGVWKHSHIFVSLLMLIAGVTHLCLNWSVLMNYLRNNVTRQFTRFRELAVAVALTGAVIAVAALGSPDPMQRVNAMTLQQIAEKSNKPVDELVALLKKEGIEVHNPADSVTEISQHNKQQPKVVTDVLARAIPDLIGPPRGAH
jgi:hypothetical protein